QPARDLDGGRPRATQVYGLRELEQIEPFLADLYSACKLQGIPARTAISDYAPGQVTVASGGKQVIYNALVASLNPGDEVVI
ncbi:MAG: hypothetical protein ACTS5I_08415, partial [Rhodanobacter sp.]